jgi:hypothetical protein
MKTQPVPFTFAGVDLVGCPANILSQHAAPAEHAQVVCLDGPEIREVRARAVEREKDYVRQLPTVTAQRKRLAHGPKFPTDNHGRPIVAILSGDMLRADEAKFHLTMFDIYGLGGGTRHDYVVGLDEAQKKLTKWASRKFRQPKISE